MRTRRTTRTAARRHTARRRSTQKRLGTERAEIKLTERRSKQSNGIKRIKKSSRAAHGRMIFAYIQSQDSFSPFLRLLVCTSLFVWGNHNDANCWLHKKHAETALCLVGRLGIAAQFRLPDGGFSPKILLVTVCVLPQAAKNPPVIRTYFMRVSTVFLTSAATASMSRAASITTMFSLSLSSSNAL